MTKEQIEALSKQGLVENSIAPLWPLFDGLDRVLAEREKLLAAAKYSLNPPKEDDYEEVERLREAVAFAEEKAPWKSR